MKQDEIIRMAREAGFVMNEEEAKLCHPTPKATSLKNMIERFAALVAAHERERVICLLKGIDQTEIESPNGWWETSTGAEFGANRIAAIRARGD